MDYCERAREVIQVEMDGLRAVQDAIGDSFGKAIDAMLECLAAGRKIVVTGVGKSLHIAQKIAATLSSTGAASVLLDPTQAMHGDLGLLKEGDVLLALSYSGASDELLALLPPARRIGVCIIAMTGAVDSQLARTSDVVLAARVPAEACPFNMAPTASSTAALVLGDALAMVLLDARGFTREDYAKLHPAGAIGRALVLRVCDIMRGPDRVACIRGDEPVRMALLAMTRARAGSCAVLDAAGRVAGIFTDGDLRRHIAARENLLDVPMREVMTPAPITVKPDALAADVIRVFAAHNVDDLLVVDGDGRLVGAVDSQDLPRMKVV